jgi:beta-lactam-binding protein with PASTA domain
VKVPDFRGLNRQQASALAGSLGLYIQVLGNTELLPSVKVISQDIFPGTMVETGTTLGLTFTETGTTD